MHLRALYRWLTGIIMVALVGLLVNQMARKPALHLSVGPVPVTTALAQRKNVDVTLDGLGTVTPLATDTVTSRVTGMLKEVHYQEGQMVRKNDLLAVIDPEPYEAVLTQAEGQLMHDKAMLDNARNDLKRYQMIYENHAVPEQEVATQEALVHEDEGQVELDSGGLKAAQINLAYTRITSPIDGRVGLRLIDVGNLISANGTNGLVIITQLQPITVIFTLSQDHLGAVQQGLRSGMPLRVEAIDSGNPKNVLETGQLTTIDNQVDPATGTFRLRAVFANTDYALWPGQLVMVRAATSVMKDAITVPERSVQSGPGDTSYLYVVEPNHTVTLRTVEVGPTGQGGVVAITRGVAAGERVVVDGQYRLINGTRVVEQRQADSVVKSR